MLYNCNYPRCKVKVHRWFFFRKSGDEPGLKVLVCCMPGRQRCCEHVMGEFCQVSNAYLFVPTLECEYRFVGQGQVTLTESSGDSLRVGDKVLLMQTKGSEYEAIRAEVYKVAKIAKSVCTLDMERAYHRSISVDTTRGILNRTLSVGCMPITQREFEALVECMGGARLKEKELLEHVKLYIRAKGYYFDDETLYNYHVCLKTRPFVILAGLSGTGKSKLSQLYAEALGHGGVRYLRLAVRPGWNDDRFLLGYLNTITGEYVTEPALDFLIRAEKDRDNLYFLCLDEMNLAHVEYYFSQFLSALEEDEAANRRIPLISDTTFALLSKAGKNPGVDASIIVPPNLLFTGTINVDETTQPLSDKVIDRANTIEFFSVELDKIPERMPLPDQITISASTWKSYIAPQPDTSYRAHIVEIGKILNKVDLGLGYRVLREIEMYLANSHNLLEPVVAFDLQVKQRILPRIRGTQAIQSALDALSVFAKKHNLPRSGQRLDEMKSRLGRDGYTSFWR
jgi:hypothetical protein